MKSFYGGGKDEEYTLTGPKRSLCYTVVKKGSTPLRRISLGSLFREIQRQWSSLLRDVSVLLVHMLKDCTTQGSLDSLTGV